MRPRVRTAWRVVGVVGALLLLLFLDLLGGAHGDGRAPVRVRGFVVDATTGAPIQGATLLTLFHPETAREPAELAEWRGMARPYEGQPREDLLRFPWIVGSARTGPDGGFEIIVGISISYRDGMSGICWFTERGSAFKVARALLVEKEGYEVLVHETKDARWDERPESDVVGTLDVGTIRITREPTR